MSKYSEQDKLRAINYYLAGHSFRETERALGINWSSIKEWVHMYRKNGVEGITKKESKLYWLFQDTRCRIYAYTSDIIS